MGTSKKKLRRKFKREQNMSPKAKAKVRKAIQIEHRNKRTVSRQKARTEVSKKAASKPKFSGDRGDLENEVSAVDKLFATVGEEEEEENAEPFDGSDASSAGAFQDIEGADAASEVEGLDDEVGELDADKHVAELQAIQEKDPEFYKFLAQSDRDLLHFELPPDPDDAEGDEGEKAKKSRVCSMDRLHSMHKAAEHSLTGLKAAMHIFHTAVRGIEGWHEQQELEEKMAKRGENKRVRTYHLKVDDDAVFSTAIEWSLSNQPRVFKCHAGVLLDKSFAKKQGKPISAKVLKEAKKRAAAKAALEGNAVEDDVVDPLRYEHWKRLNIMNRLYWQDVCFLLSKSVPGPMQHYVLRNISTPQAITWLWPLKSMRTLFLRRCTMIWCSADSHTSRMLAFLFLRNTGVMTTKLEESRKMKEPLLDDILRLMVKGFAQAASMGFSWRSHSTFRFLENCFVEMLRLDDAAAYRLGYVCIRQLAVVLRNSCIAVTHGEGKKKGQQMSMARGRKLKVKADSGKQAKKRSSYRKAMQALVAWPFVRAMYLWTKAISLLPTLRDLAFPLSMLILGAAKTQIERVQNFPFVFHCFVCQNRLGMALEVYVPISSHIMKLWNVLISAMEKAHKKRKAISGSTGLSATKAPDLEVLVHFRESQVLDGPALDAVGHNLHFLLVDHMGALSRSPAFPELASMVLTHVRRVRKKCRSEGLRRELTSFITAAETTSEDLRAKRDALTEAPLFSKFFLFPADTAMAKMRETLFKQKDADEKQRIEAEVERAKREKENEEGGPEKKREAKRKRKEESKQKKAQKKTEEEEAPTKKRRKVKLGKGKADTVEEMQFSSNEED